jgi:hypothetical protein
MPPEKEQFTGIISKAIENESMDKFMTSGRLAWNTGLQNPFRFSK